MSSRTSISHHVQCVTDHASIVILQDLEAVRPRAILDIIQAASEFRFAQDTSGAPPVVAKQCVRCSYMTSQVRAPCMAHVGVQQHHNVWMS